MQENKQKDAFLWEVWVIGGIIAALVWYFTKWWYTLAWMIVFSLIFHIFWRLSKKRAEFFLTHAEVAAAIDALSMKGTIPLRLEASVSPRVILADEKDARNDKLQYRQDLALCVCSNRAAGVDEEGKKEIAFVLLYKGKYQGEEGIFYTFHLLKWTAFPAALPEVILYWNDLSQELKVSYEGDSPFWPVGRHRWVDLYFSKVPE